MKKLKPCPFCNGSVVDIEAKVACRWDGAKKRYVLKKSANFYQASCASCFSRTDWFWNVGDVIRMWNSRAETKKNG